MGAQGVAVLDFGAFPGASDASVFVPETGVSAHPVSLAEAWLIPADSADHSGDEHLIESIKVMAGPCQAGAGFFVYGMNTSQINEPLEAIKGKQTTTTGVLQAAQNNQNQFAGGRGTRLYGQWTVGWVWN